MTDTVLPIWIYPADDGEEHEWVDDTTVVFRPQFGPGGGQRQSYGGPRLKLRRRHAATRMEERAVLQSILLELEGRTNTIRTKVHQAFRGNFMALAPELYTNPTFALGTFAWSSYSDYTLAVTDRVYRATCAGTSANGVSGPGSTSYVALQSMAVTQYAPYATRAVIRFFGTGPQTARLYSNIDPLQAAGSIEFPTRGGYQALGWCGVTTGNNSGIYTPVTGPAGSGVEVLFISAARCAMSDSPSNNLLRSEDLDNASWTKTRSSVSANADVAPDGASTADRLVEDNTASNNHFMTQSVAVAAGVADQQFAIAMKAGTRTWGWIEMGEGSGSTAVSVYINLSTGAVGTSSTGANWANLRVAVTPLGNGWFYVGLIARKTNAATSVACRVGLATGDGVGTYTGDNASYIRLWRATHKVTSFPSALISTTSAALNVVNQTGYELKVKGLPASIGDLLYPGDWFEINGELKQAVASLNADAAGLGVLRFMPQLVTPVTDGTPIIIRDPMGKFILTGSHKASNRFTTQSDIEYELEHVYE